MEPVLIPEGEIEGRLGNVVAAIASTLCPGAVVAGPVVISTLLEISMGLPGAIFGPTPGLLPRRCLLPGPLRLLLLPGLLSRLGGALLRLPGPLSWLGGALLRLPGLLSWLGGALLRLPGLLSWLGGALLLLLFRLRLGMLLPLRLRLRLGTLLLLRLRLRLGTLLLLRFRLRLGTPLLLRFRLRLGMLLLCRSRRGLPGLWFGLRFLLLFVLRDGRDNGPEKHKNGSGTNNSRDLHGHYLR